MTSSSIERRPWGDLPWEISASIMENLMGKDIASFRAVCSRWRSTPTRQVNRIHDPVSQIVKYPFLLRFRQNNKSSKAESSSDYELYSPAYNKLFISSAPEQDLCNAQLHCFNHGWLLISVVDRYFFLDPTSQKIIYLPNLDGDSTYDVYSFNRMSFSAPPTSPNCVVFGLVDMFENHVCISFIRRGDDSWESYGFEGFPNRLQSDSDIIVPFAWPNYRSAPVFHKGCFYSLGSDGVLGVFNPEEEEELDMWRILDTPHDAFMFDHYCEAYLMESPQEELISVVVGSKGKPVRVVKFNHTLLKWQDVTCLEDQAVFLSQVSCIVLDCKELHVKGLENTIHFPRFRGDYNVFYSLSSKKFHTFDGGSYASEDLCDTRLPLNSTWILPDFQLFSNQQLDWLLPNPETPIFVQQEEEDLVARFDFLRYQTCPLPSNSKSIVMGGEDSTSGAGGRKPWIIYSCKIDEEEVHRFVDLSTGMSYKRDSIEERLSGKEILGCNDGRVFLINTTDGDSVVLDASSMTIYPFPTFKDVCYFKFYFCLVYLSPQDNKIVVVMFGSLNKTHADGSTEWVSAAGFTSRVGDDEWTRVEGDCLVMDAASYEGKIYGQTIDMESHLSEIEIKTEYSALRNIECPESRVKGSRNCRGRFIESCGELLYFNMYGFGSSKVTEDIVTMIEVYRMDVETMRLEELHDLGDRAFFLCSWLGGFRCCASKSGFKRNSIYFINKYDNKLQRYDYGDDSVSFSEYYPDIKEDCLKNKFLLHF